ncbi:MAG: SIS domain-containing protein, partial [Erysipelotrichaceae bacterium]|nr:SIS domain-containing protein [Erysipelotrichaceae bacterium]
MVTMLDCIRRSEPVSRNILQHAKESTESLNKVIKDYKAIDEIFLIGSGSSFNASNAAASFIEDVCKVQVFQLLPNQFAAKKVLNTKALYIFVSQSGTSSLVKKQILKVKELGCPTVAVTDDQQSAIAKEADVNISIQVGGEEYGFRTVGFSATLLTLQLIGLRIALEAGKISEEEFNEYVNDGLKAVDNIPKVIEDSLVWFDKVKDELKSLRSLMYYGGGELFGIAVEGALKLMETPKVYISAGYEAEDGIHGPCYAFGKDDAIVFLNDGEHDVEYASSMVRFSKAELGRGYMFGPLVQDDKDLKIVPCSKYFRGLEFVPSVQIIAYQMAMINNVEVLPLTIRIPHVSTKYFQTH